MKGKKGRGGGEGIWSLKSEKKGKLDILKSNYNDYVNNMRERERERERETAKGVEGGSQNSKLKSGFKK